MKDDGKLYVNAYKLADGSTYVPKTRHMNRANAAARGRAVALASAGTVTVAYRISMREKPTDYYSKKADRERKEAAKRHLLRVV